MFANGLGNLGSITGRVISKTQNIILDASLLNTQHYKVQIKGKWSNPGKGVAPFTDRALHNSFDHLNMQTAIP